MKFLTYKDMIKLNMLCEVGCNEKTDTMQHGSLSRSSCYENPEDFLKCIQSRWCDRTTSSVQERSEARKMVYFHFIRFGPSGCGGRCWTERIQVLTDPSWLKTSKLSLVFTMNPCKSHNFTFSSCCQCAYSICAYSAFSPCSWSSGQWASPLNSILMDRPCLHF